MVPRALGESVISPTAEGPLPGGTANVFYDRVEHISFLWGLDPGEILGDCHCARTGPSAAWRRPFGPGHHESRMECPGFGAGKRRQTSVPADRDIGTSARGALIAAKFLNNGHHQPLIRAAKG